MGNITDIPKSLVHPNEKLNFLAFLKLQPITSRRRFQLITEWEQFTGRRIVRQDLENMGMPLAL